MLGGFSPLASERVDVRRGREPEQREHNPRRAGPTSALETYVPRTCHAKDRRQQEVSKTPGSSREPTTTPGVSVGLLQAGFRFETTDRTVDDRVACDDDPQGARPRLTSAGDNRKPQCLTTRPTSAP